MKSAVELAFFEIEKKQRERKEGGDGGKQQQQQGDASPKKSKITDTSSKFADQAAAKYNRLKVLEEAEKDARIKFLERQLVEQSADHKKQIKSLEDHHFHETKECEREYTDFVSKMIKKHRKEMSDSKRDMKDMQNVHKTFLESYVEASLEELRDNGGSPKL